MPKPHSTSVPVPTCSEKCKYREHGKTIVSSITKVGITDYQLACYINTVCRNYGQVVDEEGKNALHLAASCGRRDLCFWLIKTGKADLNSKDQESGYTPLHRSIFYGYINIAVFLIKMGAQINALDRDDLQTVDHVFKDRVNHDFSINDLCQVYVWGTNNNYTLGTGNHHSRAQPELLDFFRKTNTSIKQVAMDKFHSVFVSSAGRAWACGHGQGGRLGVVSEQTLLKPQPIKTGTEIVVAACVGKNHTVLLMESGMVWTCGSNDHHVLGHNPPPSVLFAPRPIHPRLLKPAGGSIEGVAAAHYHTVLWSDSAVLTFGLNGGQLGHPFLQDKTIITPKLVTKLSQKSQIVDVSASAGATVVSVKKGDIYLLHNYQIRKIASRIIDVTKVSVIGGELNPEVDQKLTAKGGEECKVMVLTSRGLVWLWQESYPYLTRCVYPLRRSLTFCGISLSSSSALLITRDGEAYSAQIKPKVNKKSLAPSPKAEVSPSSSKTKGMSFSHNSETIDCIHLSISRIPHVHRAVSLSTDPKGQNFVVIQVHPKVNLTDIPTIGESEFNQQMAAMLRDSHEDDPLHDVLIEVTNGSFPAHHLVLARVSEEFANLPRSGPVTSFKLKGVDIQVLNQVLSFAYTHDCDIIHPGPFHSNLFEGDIIKAAADVSKRLKIPILMKCLHLLKYEDGNIILKDEKLDSLEESLGKQSKYERSIFPSLHDVSITSSDGATFKAHKCVLAARLDYFNSMFTGGWREGDGTTKLTLPYPQTVVREIIDFLYTDEAPSLVEAQDVDYISSVLVVADQLFINHLKEICEVTLSGTLNLRNAAYLLQLSFTYNAEQLKNCCMQFIGLNLAAILESRALEVLDNEILEELSKYYRNMIPAMSKRFITPFSTQLSDNEIVEISTSFPVTWFYSEDLFNDNENSSKNLISSSPITMINKKRNPRNRKSSESHRKRFESVSSNSDMDCNADPTSNEKVDFDDLIERKETKKEDEWVTVDKINKIVQNRLKVVVTASTVRPTSPDFTQLVPGVSPPQHHISSPPLPQDNTHFPLLSTQTKALPNVKSSKTELKRSPAVKLSQKQRKKMISEGEAGVKEENISPPKSPWATINKNMAEVTQNVVPNRDEDEGQVKFADIIADEIQQRENLSKMKSKSLLLTQIEDKAIEDLRTFYNAANNFDERITVERVISTNIAKPIWITSHHQ